MAVDWDEEYSLGIDEIDEQHKELMNRTEKFAQAIEEGKSEQRLNYLLNFMEEYAEYHFSSEEEIMEEHDYPGMEEHQKKHTDFFDVVADLKEELEEEGASESFALEVQRFLLDWLILHLKDVDKKLADYLKEDR